MNQVIRSYFTIFPYNSTTTIHDYRIIILHQTYLDILPSGTIITILAANPKAAGEIIIFH
ncbi:MAG TPA: hypothetical protein VE619_10680 [Nitrososphaeraceae archaeon]|nr:hypothetical protein [Nitrososphaeraceae archaeon]